MKPHENPRFLEMHKSGASHDEMAAALGIKKGTLSGWVMKAIRDGILTPYKQPWTDAEIEDLKVRFVSDQSLHSMANHFKRAQLTITAFAESLGLVRQPSGPWPEERKNKLRALVNEGKSDSQCAAILKTTQKKVEGMRRRMGLKKKPDLWHPDLEAKVRILYNSGVGPAEIGRRIDMPRGAVGSKLKRMGLVRHLEYPPERKKADRSYASVSEANRARGNAPRRAKEYAAPEIIPLTARPWITRQRGECAYPHGERGNIHSCCQPVFGSLPYCESHAALCQAARAA